eukprot:TRINITY_DN9834_c0_g1_i1.p1 TRINITY_DN9834_c0_g1~~TRINITY_DN9834_c0_g1_i1.p1  ORF type:complete len:1231 (-),score=89.72 TRINITY_DN9834_c0_g1_i1:19-3711(-)
MNLKLASWNIRGHSDSARKPLKPSTIATHLTRTEADIIFLQETHHQNNNDNHKQFPSALYKNYNTTLSPESPHRGLATLTKRTLNHTNLLVNDYVIITQTHNPDHYWVNVYLDSATNTEREPQLAHINTFFANLQLAPYTPITVAGDFNFSLSAVAFDITRTTFTKNAKPPPVSMLSLMTTTHIQPLDPVDFTWFGYRKKGLSFKAIDHVFATTLPLQPPPYSLSVRHHACSDHALIVATPRAQTIPTPPTHRPTRHTTIPSHIFTHSTFPEHLARSWLLVPPMHKTLKNYKSHALARFKAWSLHNRTAPPPRTMAHLRVLSKIAQSLSNGELPPPRHVAALPISSLSHTLGTGTDIPTLKRAVMAAIADTAQFLGQPTQDSRPAPRFHRKYGPRLRKPRTSLPHLLKAADVAAHYQATFAKPAAKTPDLSHLKPIHKTFATSFPRKLFYKALHKANKKSMAGPDGIPYTLYTSAPHTAATLFERLWNKITSRHTRTDFNEALLLPFPKKPYPTEAETRPITVLNTDNRLISNTLNYLLQIHLYPTIHPAQHGFIPTKRIEPLAHALAADLYHNQQRQNPSFTLFLDLKGAYDSVSRETLFAVLERKGLPKPILHMIRNLHTDAKVTVSLQNQTPATIIVARGVKQGCPLAPLLFNVYLDTFIQAVVPKLQPQLHHFRAFADDMAISFNAPHKDLPELLRGLYTVLSSLSMTLSPTKSAFITVNYTLPPLPSPWSEVPVIDRYVYLGLLVGTKVTPTEVLKEPVNQIMATLTRLRSIKFSTPTDKIIAINTHIIPILTYLARFIYIPTRLITTLLTHLRRWVDPFNRMKTEYWTAPPSHLGPPVPIRHPRAVNLALMRSLLDVIPTPMRPATSKASPQYALKMLHKIPPPPTSTPDDLHQPSKRYFAHYQAHLHKGTPKFHILDKLRPSPNATQYLELLTNYTTLTHYLPRHPTVHMPLLIQLNIAPSMHHTRFLHQTTTCRLCTKDEQTTEHLLTQCPYTQQIATAMSSITKQHPNLAFHPKLTSREILWHSRLPPTRAAYAATFTQAAWYANTYSAATGHTLHPTTVAARALQIYRALLRTLERNLRRLPPPTYEAVLKRTPRAHLHSHKRTTSTCRQKPLPLPPTQPPPKPQNTAFQPPTFPANIHHQRTRKFQNPLLRQNPFALDPARPQPLPLQHSYSTHKAFDEDLDPQEWIDTESDSDPEADIDTDSDPEATHMTTIPTKHPN